MCPSGVGAAEHWSGNDTFQLWYVASCFLIHVSSPISFSPGGLIHSDNQRYFGCGPLPPPAL